MNRPLGLVLILAASTALFPLADNHSPTVADQCDAYNDCSTISIAYARANPDESLYLGDQFSITVTTTSGSGSSGSTNWDGSPEGIAWSYDSTIFSATIDGSVAHFTVVGNVTGSHTVTATATFQVAITTCTTSSNGQTTCSTAHTQTSVPVSERVSTRAFILTFQTRLVNVTGADGNLLRNPDGSFFPDDSFCDSWNATFLFAAKRTDIKVNVTSITAPSLEVLNYSADPLGRAGRFCYVVRADSAYRHFDAVLKARALNWQATTVGLQERTEPFAVVRYNPHFTTFTYMLYNNKNSSAYDRPFVTLVRYEGNDPGYSYGGDANAAPITAGNDTRERALINRFTFTTQGWAMRVSLIDANMTKDVKFNGSSVSVSYRLLNGSMPIITWPNRVQKYYFVASGGDLSKYVSNGMVYFNTTEEARSSDFAGGSYHLFDTTYLYEPILYNGNLVFRFFDSKGNPDQSANVTMTSRNPSPISAYLLSEAKSRFGNDLKVLKAFEKDLYRSNYTLNLKQQQNSDGRVVYIVNQTNLATVGNSSFPYFNVTITSGIGATLYQFTDQPPYLSQLETRSCSGIHTGTSLPCAKVQYQVPDSFSLFLLDSRNFSSPPSKTFLAYYLLANSLNIVQPINFSLPSGEAYYLNWLVSKGSLSPPLPLTQEPGHLTSEYQMIYGQNTTVFVNTAGGAVELEKPDLLQGGAYHLFSFNISPEGGGLTRIWVVDDKGHTLANDSLPVPLGYNSSFTRQGYVGNYSMIVPTGNDNRTISITLLSTWGARSIINGVPIDSHAQAVISIPWLLVGTVVLVLLGLNFLSRLLKVKRESSRPF